ncbi:hypothetical protein F2Q68_00033046 [Brassica cretica]|uniref:thioglucosidase n=1 Tax=Brassica cretica TaxID=69181 RepID=A0A8S9G7T2_BRACR|nr:hypothetical protein F2Q68_00033046 [Brassica cretica]
MAMQKFPLMGLLLLLTIVTSQTTADGPPETANEPVCPNMDSVTDLSRAYFPKGFLFGTATAAYQVEGAVYKTCRGRSMWDVFCKKYPNGKKENGVSEAGVKFYHDVLDELIKNDITPFVTIFHWDTPQDLEDEYGGFLDEKIVKDFRDYAEVLFKEYGGKVKHWITINEPWVYAHAGYDVGKKAPGRCSEHAKGKDVKGDCLGGKSGDEVFIVGHNLLLAHAEAVDAFRNCEKCKGGKIGIAHSPAWFEPFASKDKDKNAVSLGRSLDYMLGWHLEPTMNGDYPKTMKEKLKGKLKEFTPEQKKKLEKSTDFLGLNYYTSTFIKDIEKPDEKLPSFRLYAGSEWNWTNSEDYRIGSKPDTADLSIYSRGLRELLKYVKDKYGNQEIFIMENGYGDKPAENATKVSVELGTADHNRKTYLDRHLSSLYDAIW